MVDNSSDLTEVALSLLEGWRRYLLSFRNSEIVRFDRKYSEIQEKPEEGLGDFIDLVETLSIERLHESSDLELASPLRLVIEFSHLLTLGLEEWEHNFLIDSHSSIMVRLALIVRHRGHRVSLPRIKLR